MSVEKLIRMYGAEVAFVAEEQPATDLAGFAEQLQTAAERLERVGMDDGDAQMAATYLTDAATAEGIERELLVKRATALLKGIDDALNDYRLSA